MMNLDLERFGGAADQRAEFLKATAKALAGLKIMRNRVLVGTHVQRAKSAGGIIIPNRTLQESRFQGKVGLVLAKGPMAFKFPDECPSPEPEVGEWVFYRASDTWECGLGEDAPVRFVFDDSIVGIVENPEMIW